MDSRYNTVLFISVVDKDPSRENKKLGFSAQRLWIQIQKGVCGHFMLSLRERGYQITYKEQIPISVWARSYPGPTGLSMALMSHSQILLHTVYGEMEGIYVATNATGMP